LEKYFEGYVDLVLLDLNMPAGHGWDTFERLTALNPYLAIILITSRLNSRDHSAVAGAAAIMEKPFNMTLLLQTMNRLMAESLETRVQRAGALRSAALANQR
jgi:DNA-binding response OmpR family regulator